jgi:hypothetical protein
MRDVNLIPNTVPAFVVYTKNDDEHPGEVLLRAYPVAAWSGNGMAYVIFPGHGKLVSASNPTKFNGWSCLGVQLAPRWDVDPAVLDIVDPTGNGPFYI